MKRDNATDLENCPVLDEKLLKENYGELPPEMLCQGVALFMDDALLFKKKIESYPANSEEVELCFHSLKTMSRMIGASQLYALCIQFESAPTNEKTALQHQFSDIWERLASAIEQYSAKNQYS